MTSSLSRRTSSAYHEAGHAVVARKLGRAIAVAAIAPDDDYSFDGIVLSRSATSEAKRASSDQSALARALYIDLMVALAGPEAETLAGDQPSVSSAAADAKHAIEYAVHIACIEAGLAQPRALEPGNPIRTAGFFIIERARTEVITMLQTNWEAIVRVAGALGKRDRLTQSELDHIIADGQR